MLVFFSVILLLIFAQKYTESAKRSYAYVSTFEFGVCSSFVSSPNPRELAQLYHAKFAVTMDDQKEMYAAMILHIL